MKYGMFWKKTGLVAIALAALAIAGYAQTSTKQRARSTNLQASSGYLGVGVQSLNADDAKALGLKDTAGVKVSYVTPGAPGEKAGVHVSDVILEFNGQKVDDQDGFLASIVGKAPGTKVELTVARKSGTQKIDVILGTRPPDLALNGPPPGMVTPSAAIGPLLPSDLQAMIAGDAPVVGFEGLPLSSQLADYFGVHEGVLVVSVMANTPAEKAGLKAGDVVTKVNTMPVASTREITGAVRQAGRKTVGFTVIRNKKEITLSIEIAWNHSDVFDRDAVN
jgi:serine protease Do